MFHKPLLSDIQPTQTRYQAGDRLICTVSSEIDEVQEFRIVRAVRRYTGAHVALLVVNASHTVAELNRSREDPILLFTQKGITEETRSGVAHIVTTKVDLFAGDRIIVKTRADCVDKMRRDFKEWAGRDVEIIVFGSL